METKISGLYKEFFSCPKERKAKGRELELRIDVDGDRPMGVISGDLFATSGSTQKYLGSFRFQGVKKIKTSANEVLMTGGKGYFNSGINTFKNIQVLVALNSNPLEAGVQWIDNFGKISTCLCKFRSKYFRSVQLEHYYEEGVTPFETYQTTDGFSPTQHRSHPIGIVEAFAEAGIEIVIAKEKQNSVPHPKGALSEDPVWTESSLHDAMIKHFGNLKDVPQWKVWLLSAQEYVICTTKGIMLTHNGKSRIGCVVFQNATGWQSPEEKRMRLFIYIHELGHCFNLRHPWNKYQAATPKPEAEGYSSLSWMNYPWKYYLSEGVRGTDAFWNAFRFEFSDSELVHLRHGFRDDVIFGGNTFSQEA